MMFSSSVMAQDQSADSLLERLQKLQSRVQHLQIRAATEEIQSSTEVYDIGQLYYTERFSTTPLTEFGGSVRFGIDYNNFASQSITTRIGGDVEESLRRLDELLAEVEEIVSQSGSEEAESLLEEARYFRDQAESELNAGEEEDALQSMNISESLAQEAARVAGQEITTQTEDQEWDAFSEFRLDFTYRPGPNAEYQWTNRLREGDEYLQERLETEIDYQLTESLKLEIDHEFRIRDYQDRILDDFLDSSLLVRTSWEMAKGVILRLENDFDIKNEYQADTDEGYWIDSPRVSLEFSWGSFHQLEFSYDLRTQEFFDSDDQDYNSLRHLFRQEYDYYGRSWRLNLSAEEEWKSYRKSRDENDYRNMLLEGDFSFDFWGGFTLGLRNGVEVRRYELLEDTNSDYEEWTLEPSFETRWTRTLTQTLRYEWIGRSHHDRDGSDGYEKKIGDFDEHRLSLDTWWEVTDAFNLSFTLNGEWRRYRNGQVGEYLFYLPDFRPPSNYFRYGYSASFDYDLTENLRLSGSFYYSKEEHARYSSYDLEETTANLEVKLSF